MKVNINKLYNICILDRRIEYKPMRIKISKNTVYTEEVPVYCVYTNTVMKVRGSDQDRLTTENTKYKYLSPRHGPLVLYLFEHLWFNGETTRRKTVALETQMHHIDFVHKRPSTDYIYDILLNYHMQRYSFLNKLKHLKEPTRWRERHAESNRTITSVNYLRKQLDRGDNYENIFI